MSVQSANDPTAISFARIAAMVRRYWYLLRSSWPRLLELIYWPAVQMLMWGFLQMYVNQNAGFFLNLLLTGWAVGIFVSGLVLRNGLGAENLAWTIMFIFLPLTCVYYPVSVLPEWLQVVAWMLPPTYVFEGMRALMIDHVFRGDLMLQALVINAALFAAGTAGFLALLKSARHSGSL